MRKYICDRCQKETKYKKLLEIKNVSKSYILADVEGQEYCEECILEFIYPEFDNE